MPTANQGETQRFLGTAQEDGVAIPASSWQFRVVRAEDYSLVYTAPDDGSILPIGETQARIFVLLDFPAGDYIGVWSAIDGTGVRRIGETAFSIRSVLIPDTGLIVTVGEATGYTTIRGITEDAILKAQVWQESKKLGVVITAGLIERWTWLDSAHKRKNVRGRKDLDLLKRAVSFRAAALTPGLMDDFCDEFVAMGARLSSTWSSVSQSPTSISGSFRERKVDTPEIDEDNPATRAALSYLRKLSKNRRGASARVGVNLSPTSGNSGDREGWWHEPGDRFIVHRD